MNVETSTSTAMTRPPFLVEAIGLGKRYGAVEALKTLSFALYPGEVVGLLGPNGAGKTTTLKLLLGLLRPTAGSAKILGLDCTTQSREVKQGIGYSPDEPQFYDFLTGRETIDFVIDVRGLVADAAWTDLTPVVRALDFADQLDELTSAYSHGMKKKLALLCALVHRPRVLLLDEPTNGLDPPTAHRVRELLLERAAAGTAVLLSTHLLEMADRLCHRMLVVNRGQLIAQGSTAEVRAQAGVDDKATLETAFLRLVGA